MRYEKGHKDASRQKIMHVASERFRADGIAATGLAAIMSDAGMTNGAFYPHFQSKADLVRETVVAAIDGQCDQWRQAISAEGLDAAITAYLSPAHRDKPGTGCTLAALLPELARQPAETRAAYSGRFDALASEIASNLPPGTEDPDAVALAIYATLIGTLQLARAVDSNDLSDRILAAGANAARSLAHVGSRGNA
jgi:TetR/AcrR family transcriptional repressor of nem operon